MDTIAVIVACWLGIMILFALALSGLGPSEEERAADDEAFMEAMRAQSPALRSFETRAAHGFQAGYTNDHVGPEIRTRKH